MLAVERRNLILEKLQEEKKVVVSELSREFRVSEETIRRDLEKLDKDGYAVKSYGGAVLNETTSLDMPFHVRKKNNSGGKQKIAKLVAGLIEDGDHIRLREVSLSYDLPEQWLRKVRISSASLGFTVTNLGLIWRANGADIDPDFIPNSNSLEMAPTPSYNFSLNLNF